MELLKHIMLFLISPINLAITFLLAGFFVSFFYKKLGFALKALSFLWVLVFSQPYVSDLLLFPLEHNYEYPILDDKSPAPEYIFVLACYYSTHGDVPETSRWSECSLQRNIEALKLHLKTGSPIIITGGYFLHDKTVNYAEMSREFFISLGVSENDIAIFPEGKNTAQEIDSARELLSEGEIWVVSSATHIKRLQRYFNTHNFEGVFFPVNHHTVGQLTPYIVLPSARALIRTELAFYEYAALFKQLALLD
jgi:uncharacterized SAM-binding protein YcdF (DUF218 family)